uniref:Protein stunted-like n=1 Tax=Timema bartmani TaxID=61472 RepID=A0A7R9I061_9NEOP|nr:unnamed protein product [Timema bartmani]
MVTCRHPWSQGLVRGASAHFVTIRTVLHLITYVNYSNIAARLLRKALKPELRADAAKREESTVRFTPWKDGKSQSKFHTG